VSTTGKQELNRLNPFFGIKSLGISTRGPMSASHFTSSMYRKPQGRRVTSTEAIGFTNRIHISPEI
jgi:hypothetical protein